MGCLEETLSWNPKIKTAQGEVKEVLDNRVPNTAHIVCQGVWGLCDACLMDASVSRAVGVYKSWMNIYSFLVIWIHKQYLLIVLNSWKDS